jgi:hypothetical protein
MGQFTFAGCGAICVVGLALVVNGETAPGGTVWYPPP